MKPQPKNKTPRDPAYLKWISQQKCLLMFDEDIQCFGDVVPHHCGDSGGMGIKCSDYETVPLCAGAHHPYVHAKGEPWDKKYAKRLFKLYLKLWREDCGKDEQERL